VQFDYDSSTYTSEGFLNKSDKYPTLSFTEYDLVNGGFSQIRPQLQIEVDTLVYVRNVGDGVWYMRYFSHFTSDGSVACYSLQKKSTETDILEGWTVYSLENPLI